MKTFIYIDKQQNKKTITKLKTIRFFFPFYPSKIFNSIYMMSFIGILLAIRIVLSFLNIPLIGFGITVSFSWLPVYICGWFFGPVAGLVFGFVADTIVWSISGGLWFWMYAIQEPLVGMIAGLIGALFIILKSKSLKIQMSIQKIFILFFILFTILIVILQFSNIENNIFQESGAFRNELIFVILICLFMLIFLIVNETQSLIMFKKIKKHKNTNNYVIYLFVSMMIIFSITLFSFILGPISYVKYIEFLNGAAPNKFLQYGTMYYLVPRVLKESLKTPIYILLVTGIIVAIDDQFYQIVNKQKIKWR